MIPSGTRSSVGLVTSVSSVPPFGVSEYTRSDHGIVGAAAAISIRFPPGLRHGT